MRHIIIDAEVNSYMPNKNAGPFYFTEKEFKAIHYLEKVAKEAGFDVQISGYAFSVREEKDEKGNRILPKKYFDNLDHEICSHDIKVQTFPNIRTMQGYIQKNGYEVVIWGGGYIGRKCIRILKEHGIEINYFQYKNQGVLWIPNNHYEFEMESY